MFRAHVVVVEAIGFFASQCQHLLCAWSEIIHHVAAILNRRTFQRYMACLSAVDQCCNWLQSNFYINRTSGILNNFRLRMSEAFRGWEKSGTQNCRDAGLNLVGGGAAGSAARAAQPGQQTPA